MSQQGNKTPHTP